MHRTRRLAVVAVAWATPLAWIAVALLAGPSDGTTVSSPTAYFGADPWGERVTVQRVYGDSPLVEGDEVEEVDGVPLADWVGRSEDKQVGDIAVYHVRRTGKGLDRTINVEVVLARYPLAAAVADNLTIVVLLAGLLCCASLVAWRRPRDPAALALLVAAATAPAAVTAYPFGLGVVDLAGGRGLWPHVGGELAATVGTGALLVLALTFPRPRPWLRSRALWVAAWLVPFLGYAAWLAVALRESPGLARLQATATLVLPALAVTLPLVVVAQAEAYRHAPAREDRVAQRLLALVGGSAVVVHLLLGDLPWLLDGDPLVPWDVLALVLGPVVLGALVVALLRHRLAEIDSALRRSLVQIMVATAVGSVFLVAVAGLGLASETSFESMLAGGAVALVLVPLALGLRRVVARRLYGDREFPYRVVSQLRQLEPRTTPDDALREMLEVLRRSLRLTYAAVETDGRTTAVGDPRGSPTAVVLQAGGATLGQLFLEVEPDRDPFGPRDRRLLEDVGVQVGALVQAVTINRELQRSRESLVAAREEERRRVRRDLHDGLGPALATMAMKLEVARDLIGEDPDSASVLVGQLTEQTRAEIAEIRRLVDGLRPPALDQLGLVTALRQRAEEHDAAVRAAGHGLDWTVDAADDVEPLPAAVEVAAYRIVVEAVANAVRHSGGTACRVVLRRSGGHLELEVADDGVGMPTDPPPGVGLGSMRERAEELGGTFDLQPTGQGARILVRLPLSTIDETPR